MTVAEKSTLFAAALLWGGCVAFMGLSFSVMAEPYDFDVAKQLFWILLGFTFAAPFWLPVLISGSSSLIASVIRLCSIFFLMLFAAMAAHQFYFDVNRSFSGNEVSLIELTLDSLIAIFSIVSAALVFRSDRSLRKKTSNKAI